MPFLGSNATILAALAFVLGGLIVYLIQSRVRGFFRRTKEDTVTVQTIAEHVRSVGKLVGLEVCAKEIATATSGWAWLPPLLLSQARLAMIFHFEKQYTIDLSRLDAGDVRDIGEGRFRISLPPIEGHLRLLDLTPYDIQNARILGLLDVIPMTADRQREMMKRAQTQAADLYESNNPRYQSEAAASIERHLRSLLGLVGVQAEFEWRDGRRAVVVEEAAPVSAKRRHRESAEGRTRTADLRVMNPAL